MFPYRAEQYNQYLIIVINRLITPLIHFYIFTADAHAVTLPHEVLPQFHPLCAPDIPQKPTTSDCNFHLLSLTSIQCAIIPRNDSFVLLAVQPSAVVKIFPGAACVFFVSHLVCLKINTPPTRISVLRSFNCSMNLL